MEVCDHGTLQSLQIGTVSNLDLLLVMNGSSHGCAVVCDDVAGIGRQPNGTSGAKFLTN